MSEERQTAVPENTIPPRVNPRDEGGLRAPPELRGWRKAWWWFDFIILVKLARLRFVAILALIGVVITQWDTLHAYLDKLTRPKLAAQEQANGMEYFCPMHPAVVRDNDREKCPICFMPLARRTKGSAITDALPAGTVNRVQLSPYRVVLAGIQTMAVEYHPLTKEIQAVGYVEFNERAQRTVSARVAGRIDKLIANETGQMVHAGDELALLYSPELTVTFQNLRDAKKSGKRDYLEAAKVRLQLLGIDDEQIEQALVDDSAMTHVRIRSPIGGHVITKYVREGQYVQEGMPLYDLADLSTVWIQAQIYETDLAFLPVGENHDGASSTASDVSMVATSRAYPDRQFPGKLTFIYPHVDRATRTLTVRFEVENPSHLLRPGSTTTVTLRLPPTVKGLLGSAAHDPTRDAELLQGRALAVPDDAVIDSGSQQVVYRETSPGLYEGVAVRLGPAMTGSQGEILYPVLSGLAAGDRVVTHGSFLVDAETRLNPAAGSMYLAANGGREKNRDEKSVNVRPSTPEDPDVRRDRAFAKLSSADRKLALAQQYCPVRRENRLGSMGTPYKTRIGEQTIFLCCAGCDEAARSHPRRTLAAIKELKRRAADRATR